MSFGRSSGAGSVGVGISSVLMIFVALCMTIFAVLSFLSAHADGELAKRIAQASAAYYQADAAAERKLADIAAAAGAGADLNSALAGVEGVELTASPEGTVVSYDTEIDERRTLHVELLLDPSAPEGFTRRVWKVTAGSAPAEESTLGVLQDFSLLGG